MNTFAAIASSVQRRRSSALLVGLPVLAALVGAIIALLVRGGSDEPSKDVAAATHVVAVDDMRVTLPQGWTRADSGPLVRGFDRAHTAFVTSASTDVAVTLLPPASPSLLPRPLVAAATPTPRVTRAGRVRAYHYVTALGAKQVVDLYATPTTRGTLTLACQTTVYELDECEQALSSVRLAKGSFLPLNADAAFLEALPTVVATLNADRAPLRARLAAAATPEAGARAATRLAQAYAAAANALRPLLPPQGNPRETVRLLDRLRTRHAAMADALLARDRAGFARAAHGIGADEARLAAGLRDWERVLRQ